MLTIILMDQRTGRCQSKRQFIIQQRWMHLWSAATAPHLQFDYHSRRSCAACVGIESLIASEVSCLREPWRAQFLCMKNFLIGGPLCHSTCRQVGHSNTRVDSRILRDDVDHHPHGSANRTVPKQAPVHNSTALNAPLKRGNSPTSSVWLPLTQIMRRLRGDWIANCIWSLVSSRAMKGSVSLHEELFDWRPTLPLDLPTSRTLQHKGGLTHIAWWCWPSSSWISEPDGAKASASS